VVEDAPILRAFNQFEKVGCLGKMLPVNEKGQLSLETLASEIRPRTSLLSLQWAHGLTGVIQPIEAIAKLCQERGIHLHVDASAVIGKLFFRFQDLPCDYLSFDGEKIHAPKGTAAVVTKGATIPLPSYNIAGWVALSTALKEAFDRFDHMATEVARLRDKLERGVEGAQVFFQDVERLPNTAVIAFPGVHAEALLFFLNRKGVYATCGGGNAQKLSHVLQLCGVEPSLAQSAVSFNLSYETTEEEIDLALEVIHQAVKKLRQLGEKV
jgi:cysteine desulfurase